MELLRQERLVRKMSDLFEVKPIKDYEDDAYNPDITIEKEREEALNKFNASDQKHNSENPKSPDEVDDNTLSLMFGDNWNGEYSDVTPIISKAAEEIATQMTVYSSVGSFLQAQESSIKDRAYMNSGLYQLNQAVENTKVHYESLANTFTNFKSFSPIGGSNNILRDTDAILANMESSISAIMKMEDVVTGAINLIQQGGNIVGTDLQSTVYDQVTFASSLAGQQNLENMLAKFPHSVVDKFVNADFTQDLLTLPKRLYSKMVNVMTILSSIKVPTNLEAVLETVGTLRSAVSEMQDAVNMLTKSATTINNMRANISSGNYIGVFIQAQDCCKFVEKTSQFAAQYPYNQAYETEGGHLFETDNTPGKERLHIQHCTGTDVEIAPNGDMVSKIKNDCQFIIEKDFQNHVKGDQLLLVDKTAEIESKSMKFTAAEDLNISSKKTVYTTDTLNIFADDTLITNNKTLTIATNSSSSVSSVGPMYITSDSQIVIDAPTILIGSGRTQLINMNSSSTNIKSGTVYVSDGLIKMNGFITLN